MNKDLENLIKDETDALANLSNSAALIFGSLEDINWSGYYLYKESQLILGPFQGKTACIRIPLGRGVCGTAAEKREPQLVQNVHQFPGHIACDGASASEIVLPIIVEGKLAGVLDIDSPSIGRFDTDDLHGLQKFVDIITQYVDFESFLHA